MTTNIVPMIETSNNELVVSSEQIATGAGVEHRATLQLIETNRAELEEFGQIAFEMRSGEVRAQGGTGRPTRVALLNEPQAMLLMTFQRNTAQVKAFKVALIKEFKRLAEVQRFDPASLTRMDILKMALESETRVHELEMKIEADAGKVAYVDEHVDPKDVTLFRTVCRNLQINESDLRKALIYRRWIYVSTTYIMGSYTVKEYAAHHNFQAYFKVCKYHNKKTGSVTNRETLKVTPEGVAAITRFVEKLTKEYGSVRDALPHLEIKYNQRKGIAA
ncbi:Rha family transcriptional regulator [Glutamicibacter arilaitensis]|uniref:Rha family transcriptional regulator n=1 Tax=Glutamicibacter arilaitensis TaxID=256701 RepID=UPI003FCFD88E